MAQGLTAMHEITSRFVAQVHGIFLLLNREILNVEQLRIRFRSIVTTQSTIHLAPEFGNLSHARSLAAGASIKMIVIARRNDAAIFPIS
jgi:hypothetical protein